MSGGVGTGPGPFPSFPFLPLSFSSPSPEGPGRRPGCGSGMGRSQRGGSREEGPSPAGLRDVRGSGGPAAPALRLCLCVYTDIYTCLLFRYLPVQGEAAGAGPA